MSTHTHSNAMMPGHGHHSMQVDKLMSHSDASHVAVSSGDWSDPSTWKGGKVPGKDATVLIPKGIDVTYDAGGGASGPVALETVRVDGTLSFSRDVDTAMLVETIVTSHGSTFEVGSMDDPMPSDITATITFRDTKLQSGVDQLSHGLVAFGHVDIQGAEKESYVTLDDGVSAGARSVEVDGDLGNWAVGDQILLVGTEYGGTNSDGTLNTQDEVRTITAIKGDTIVFDRPLQYDHETPEDLDVDTYVGNLSRNVVFESENPNGVRGHIMLHNGTPDPKDGSINCIRYAEFNELGRSDSSKAHNDANPIGRYPLHLHEIGTGAGLTPSMIEGNAVVGSPGWGIVHHSSHAMINHNIVYDVAGSGIISEVGDETGMWVGNLVSSVTGVDTEDLSLFGREGAAYENQSRVVFQQDNIAANSLIGWNYSGRENFAVDEDNDNAPRDGEHRKMFERDQVPFDPSPFDVALDHEEPPIIDFVGNQVIASEIGLRVFHRQFSDDTDTMSVMTDFDIWGGKDAVHLDNYASNYQFMDSVWQGEGTGFRIERKTSSVVFNNVDFHDFGTGYRSYGVNHEVVLIDTEFHDVRSNFRLEDLMKNVSSSALRNDLVRQFQQDHGINYNNPMPTILSSDRLREVDAITFRAAPDADLTISPNDKNINVKGTITDSVGVRTYNEYVIAKAPSGKGTSKDFDGVDMRFGSYSAGLKSSFTDDEFMELHGTWQKADGTWVVPVVNWITDRLTGDQHPVIIEINLVGFSADKLNGYKLDGYPDPGINNPGFDTGVDTGGDTGENVEQGSVGNDVMRGSSGIDIFDAGGGADTLYGFGGADELLGGQGFDKIEAGSGHDMVMGQAGFDRLHGQDGNDTLYGSRGEDMVWGGQGEDTIFGGKMDDKIQGGADDDYLSGDRGNDTVDGQQGDDTIFGGSGNDILTGGDGEDLMFGGTGRDTLTGGNGDDTMNGNAGRDTLYGGNGSDVIFGGNGNDTLDGQNHNDVLYGGAGVDTLTGGGGADIFTIQKGDGHDTITDFGTGADRLNLTEWGFDSLSDVNDALEVQNGATVLVLDEATSVTLADFAGTFDASDLLL